MLHQFFPAVIDDQKILLIEKIIIIILLVEDIGSGRTPGESLTLGPNRFSY